VTNGAGDPQTHVPGKEEKGERGMVGRWEIELKTKKQQQSEEDSLFTKYDIGMQDNTI